MWSGNFGAVSIALGLVFGLWFFVIGGILVLGAVIGYSVEAQARRPVARRRPVR